MLRGVSLREDILKFVEKMFNALFIKLVKQNASRTFYTKGRILTGPYLPL